jgi:dihydrofolate reductase
MIRAIVCVDEKWAIGKNNDLLFHLKKDMQFFKEKTTMSIVVMGENTLLSLPGGKPLKDRINIVLCPEGHEHPGCVCFHDFDKLVKQLKVLNSDIYVIGGGMLYNSMLPYYDEVYVTKVKADGEGTVFFPNLDENPDFGIADISEDIDDNGYTLNFCTYKRLFNYA